MTETRLKHQFRPQRGSTGCRMCGRPEADDRHWTLTPPCIRCGERPTLRRDGLCDSCDATTKTPAWVRRAQANALPQKDFTDA